MPQDSIWQQILDYSHRADPYPLYAELRKTPVVWAEDGSYVVSTYREIVALLHDPRLSSDRRNFPEYDADAPTQASEEGPAGLPPPFIQTDPPDHDRARRLLTWNFGPPHRPGRIDSMIPDMFGIVTGEIDDFAGKDDVAGKDRSGTTRVDIVDDFAYPFPVTVICRLLGVPRDDEPRFQAMSDAVIKAVDPTTGGITERQRRRDKANADLGQYFAELLDARRGQPGDDLLSGLLSGDGAEAAMPYEQVLSNAALLLVAGHETTVNLITNGMLTLLRHPEVLDRLRRGDEPDLAARVVEELLRYEPPVQFLANSRNTLDDIEVGGTTIPKGSPVTLVLAAGSRDPDFVHDPDRFDPDREHNEHLGFGGGIHYCFGAPLARPETQIALTELACRLRNPRLLADPPPYRASPSLRGPRHLLVEIDGVDPARPGAERPTAVG
ncbi:cytochrome P450 [Actinopolymorpha pittospori]|uniref:Cytochrome P450 n=1 Tax=Actinopolymorpha pittospori TaxID=648752 RepID=A0A927MP85_9ACTN|nr:cytochrome P450 [Actinopolymorpha pittospori]MBE1604341.1 cytochrome P450 [Actinopolymorpha pittospori]